TFGWTPAAEVRHADQAETYTRAIKQSRVFTLTATNAYGCDTSADVTVRVLDSCLISLELVGPDGFCADSLVTYHAIVTGGLMPSDYRISWTADPAINGIVDSVNTPIVQIRPNGPVHLSVTVTDISAHAAKCPVQTLSKSIDVNPSSKQVLTASLALTTTGDYCPGAPMSFRAKAYLDGLEHSLSGRYAWYRIRTGLIESLGYGQDTYMAHDAQDGDSYFAVAESDADGCMANFTAATDTLTVTYLPYPPAFDVNKLFGYGLPGCTPDTAAVEIVMSEDRDLFEYSIDSGKTFQDSPVFSPVEEGDYYTAVRYKDGQCVRYGDVVVHVHISHDTLPELTPAPDADYCEGDTLAPLAVKATVIDAVIRWYAEDSCKTLLGEGDTLDINALNLGVGLHAFYVRQELTNCVSLPVQTLINILSKDAKDIAFTLAAEDFRPCLNETTDVYFLPDVAAGFVFDGTLTLTMTPVVNGVWMTDQAYTQTYTPDVKRVLDTIAV
ncbi:MAG: hypothetical protein K2H70_03240, partial [Bacteroidales bacterium]|nr:hypothetical protein [Bacteroidales bacterium]